MSPGHKKVFYVKWNSIFFNSNVNVSSLKLNFFIPCTSLWYFQNIFCLQKSYFRIGRNYSSEYSKLHNTFFKAWQSCSIGMSRRRYNRSTLVGTVAPRYLMPSCLFLRSKKINLNLKYFYLICIFGVLLHHTESLKSFLGLTCYPLLFTVSFLQRISGANCIVYCCCSPDLENPLVKVERVWNRRNSLTEEEIK